MMITELDPGADPRLAAVFAAASAPAELPLAGEPAGLTAYRRAHRPSRLVAALGPRPVHLVVAGLFSGVILAGGVATAATGSVPLVGHHVSAAAVTPAPEGQTSDPAAGSTAGGESSSPSDISDSGPGTSGHPAAKPTLGSVTKGAATCTAASHGKCQAGRHGEALDAHTHHGPSSAAHAHPQTPAGAHQRTAHRPGFAGLRGRHGTTHHSG